MTDSETKQAEPTLKICVACKCPMLLKFYSINPKTEKYLKCCKECLIKAKTMRDNTPKVDCPHSDCGVKCSTTRNLKKHIKAVHDKIKDIDCPHSDCEFKCSESVVLKRHIKAVHDKIQDNECPYSECEFKCSQNGGLKTHIKAVHDKIRDFVCPNPKCGYASSHNCHLQTHLEVCGDSMTRPEREVANALDMMEINYENEKRFDDCKDKYTLPFDFYIPDLDCLIEYDGIHHFKPIRGQDRLEYYQRHDTIKTQFCIDTQRYLLRIPYDHTETIKDLVYGFIHRICADRFH